MENTAARKKRVRRMAQRQGLTAQEQPDGTWRLVNTLSHQVEMAKIDLDVAEAWLQNRERLPGGKA